MQEGISGFAGDPPEGTCRPYHFLMSRIQGITFGDPLLKNLQGIPLPYEPDTGDYLRRSPGGSPATIK